MRRVTLAIAALFLATSAQASADSLPKEFLGKYCRSGDYDSIYFPDENNRCFDTKGEMIGSEALEIKPNEFVGWEFSCDFNSVKVKWDPKISVATKTPLGADVAYIVASCGGEGYEWKERVKIYLAKGYLFLESKEIKPHPPGNGDSARSRNSKAVSRRLVPDQMADRL